MLNTSAHRKTREQRPDVAGNTNPFPSAHKRMALDTDVMERMFFQTSSQRAMKDHSRDPENARLAKGVSMKQLCQPAEVKPCYSSVPSMSGADVTSKRDFGLKSLAAVPINNELREMITRNNREGDVVRQASGRMLSLSSETTSKNCFSPKQLSFEEIAASAARKQRDRRLTINPGAQLLEKESHLHRDYASAGHGGSWCRASTVKPVVNQPPLPQPQHSFASLNTSYNREFIDRTQPRYKRRASVGAVARHEELLGGKAAGPGAR